MAESNLPRLRRQLFWSTCMCAAIGVLSLYVAIEGTELWLWLRILDGVMGVVSACIVGWIISNWRRGRYHNDE